jgi:hypothetical protein
MDMPYYMMLSNDIRGTFTSAVTKQQIIDSLKTKGIKNPTKAQLNGLLTPKKMGKITTTSIPSGYTLLLGSDRTDSLKFPIPLYEYFGGEEAFFQRQPGPDKGDWLACVKLYNHDNPKIANFMVVALVDNRTIKAANIKWDKEDPPPSIWKTHAKTALGPEKETATVFSAFDTASWT